MIAAKQIFVVSNTTANFLCFTAKEAVSTVRMNKSGDAPIVYLETSPTGEEGSWSDFVVGETTITLPNIGNKVYFRAKQDNERFGAGSWGDYNYFVMTGKIAASGNINTLLKADGSILDLTTDYFRDYCYTNMFSNCVSLTKAPELPATTLAQGCYEGMFKGCSSLNSAPELPATTLASYCYNGMFLGCASLTKAPELPATTLAEGCYASMFDNCTSLTKAPELPATTLAEDCYDSMFKDCSSLTIAPELPATELTTYCYYWLFYGCTSLTQAPELPATTLADNCYNSMFYGCSSLNSLTTNQTSFDECTDWVSGVSATGTLYCTYNLNVSRGESACPEGWNVVRPDNLCFTAQAANSSVGMAMVGSAPSVNLMVSRNGIDWEEFIVGQDPISLPNIGDKVYFNAGVGGNTTFASSNTVYNKFTMTGRVAASGNIMSLINADDAIPSIPSESCFACLFIGCESLTAAPKLPYTTLAHNCYFSMFSGCTSLTAAPELPATTLATNCYRNMFKDCTSLTVAPELPATTLTKYCYNYMFWGCTSLTVAPELPATTLANFCYYYMFKDCTSLTVAPELPATTLASNCYVGMFYNCSSLTVAPELPATTLANSCYSNMFQNCSSITHVRTHQSSFTGCNGWLSGVSAIGTFECLSSLGTEETITRGESACPTGWTVINDIAI